jgi:hypothetical protein
MPLDVVTHPVMGSLYEIFLAVQGIHEVKMVRPGEVAYDERLILALHHCIPVGYQRLIHFIYAMPSCMAIGVQ